MNNDPEDIPMPWTAEPLFEIEDSLYTEGDARSRFEFETLVEAGVIGPIEAAKTILEKRRGK